MGKHAQLVMGPAGCGKSTYCQTIRKHCENASRVVHVVNLDPAAEIFEEPPSVDIKNLITVDEVMTELNYGPNGGLIYAMEHLLENIDWLLDEIGDFDDDYLIIDCPGQIELYSHMTLMKQFTDQLEQAGYRVCALYLLDSQFMVDSAKFISGALSCLAAMIRMELPHVNVLTKMDLVSKGAQKSRKMEEFLEMDISSIVSRLDKETGPRFKALNNAMGTLLEDYGMVNFIPLDITDPDSIFCVLQTVDNAIQYGEDLDVKESLNFEELDEEQDEG